MFGGQGGVQSRGDDKGLGAQTAGARATSQSYLMGVFGLWCRRAKAPPTAFSFSSVGLKSAGKKGRGLFCGGEGGWPAAVANSVVCIFILSVLLIRTLLIVEESVKLSVQCLGTKMFW